MYNDEDMGDFMKSDKLSVTKYNSVKPVENMLQSRSENGIQLAFNLIDFHVKFHDKTLKYFFS